MYRFLAVLAFSLFSVDSVGQAQESLYIDSQDNDLAYRYSSPGSQAYGYPRSKSKYGSILRRPYYTRSYGYYGQTPSRYYTAPYAYHRTPFYYNYPLYYNYPAQNYYVPGGIYSIGW